MHCLHIYTSNTCKPKNQDNHDPHKGEYLKKGARGEGKEEKRKKKEKEKEEKRKKGVGVNRKKEGHNKWLVDLATPTKKKNE